MVAVIETGARLDAADEAIQQPSHLDVAVMLFARLRIEGEERLRFGPTSSAEIDLARDPTNQLIEAAHLQREAKMGTIFGDLVLAGISDGVTRFGLYSAPFRVELAETLRKLLVDRGWIL